MADLVAVATLALHYLLVVFLVNSWRAAALPFSIAAISFVILAGIGLLHWHRNELSQPVRRWVTLAVRSVVLGSAFFGADFLIALAHGIANPFRYPGGLLGLPLTFLICPCGTIICLAGVAKAYYSEHATRGGRRLDDA